MSSQIFDPVVPRQSTHSLKWERYGDRDIIPMWVADMDFPIAEPIQAALQERLKHPIFGYTVAPDSLGESIAAHLDAEYGWQIDTDWLVYLPGVVSGLAASCRAYCSQDDRILVNPPIYHHFYDAHVAESHVLDRVPLHKVDDRWTYDMAAMRAACQPNTRMVMMCSPHNPTCTVFTADELRALAALCAEQNILMISDEIHCDLVLDRNVRHTPTAVACPEQADRMVTLMSGSKTWNLAGLNCSFAIISNPELRDRFRQACQSIVPMVPPLAYLATEVAYRDGGPWRAGLLDYLRGNLEYLAQQIATIPGLRLEPLQATYLAWIDASALGVENAQLFFEEHGVGLSGGEQFGQAHYVRLNFACPRDTLEAGVARMRKACEAARR